MQINIIKRIIVFGFLTLTNAGEPDVDLDIYPKIDENGDFSIHMPGYAPEKDDDYVCTAIMAPPSYIREFHPFTHADRVHHMLIFGCDGDDFVLQQRIIKNCMSPSIYCASSSTPRILYAWAKNAPALILPDGIGTAVGHEGDGARIIVMQMHFATPLQGNVLSYAGLTFHTQQERPPQISSVYLFVSGETIPAHQEAYYVNMSLKYTDPQPIRPIAYRTHAHTMGRVISAVVHHPDTDQFEIIGKRNPNWPQIFAPVDKVITIQTGDDLLATCRFDSSNKDSETYMGMTHDAEMCNFYMMYAYNSSLDYDPLNTRPSMLAHHIDYKLWSRYPPEAVSLLPVNETLEESALGTAIRFAHRPVLFKRASWSQPDYYSDYDRPAAGLRMPGDPSATTQATTPPVTPPSVLKTCTDCVVDRGAWSKLGDIQLGQVSGLAVDPTNDHLFVFHRGSRVWDAYAFQMNNKLSSEDTVKENAIIEVKFDGNEPTVVRSFGADLFYMPHSITVDSKRNIWLTDVGAHQVIKMAPKSDGSYRVDLTLGKKLQPSSDQQGFCKPTGVAIGPDDSIYVTDGYCNARVMVFDSTGRFKRQFDTPLQNGALHPPQLNLPHDIVIDRSAGSLLIADRENGRVLVTNYNGEYRGEILPTRAFDNVYSVDINSMAKTVFFIPGEPPSRMANGKIQAFAADIDTKQIRYAFTPDEKNGDFNRPHVIRVSTDGQYIYTAELAVGKIRRFEVTKDRTTFKHEHHHEDGKPTDDATPMSHDHSAMTTTEPVLSKIESTPNKKAEPTKPISSNDNTDASKLPVGDLAASLPKYTGYLLAGTLVPCIIVGLVYLCLKMRSRGKKNRLTGAAHFNGLGKASLLTTRDRKGFKPLRTDDVDAVDLTSDESEDDMLFNRTPAR